MAHYVNNDDVQTRIYALIDLQRRLDKFVEDAHKLADAWLDATLPTEVDDIGGDLYPFTASYDEWVYDLDDFAESATEDINRLIQETKQGE